MARDDYEAAEDEFEEAFDELEDKRRAYALTTENADWEIADQELTEAEERYSNATIWWNNAQDEEDAAVNALPGIEGAYEDAEGALGGFNYDATFEYETYEDWANPEDEFADDPSQ